MAACGFLIPMLLGGGAAFVVAPLYTPPGGEVSGNTGFVLFMAVAMAVTAVPVLASIIRERGAASTVAGVVSMTSAGVIDAVGWLVLAAAVIAGGTSGQEHLSLPATVALFVVYMAAMLFVVRPALHRWLARPDAVPGGDLPVVAALAMASAWATSALGLHVIFGAFVAGLIMPRGADGAPDVNLVRPLQDSGTILLPVFFMVSGLSVDIGALTGRDLALLAIFTAVAVVGKVGGGYLGARLGGLPSRDAAVIGVMLNTRGLTELIALNIGLQSGIIDQSLYTVLVIVALITTVATGPFLTLLRFPTPTPATAALTTSTPAPTAVPVPPRSTPDPAVGPGPIAPQGPRTQRRRQRFADHREAVEGQLKDQADMADRGATPIERRVGRRVRPGPRTRAGPFTCGARACKRSAPRGPRARRASSARQSGCVGWRPVHPARTAPPTPGSESAVQRRSRRTNAPPTGTRPDDGADVEPSRAAGPGWPQGRSTAGTWC